MRGSDERPRSFWSQATLALLADEWLKTMQRDSLQVIGNCQAMQIWLMKLGRSYSGWTHASQIVSSLNLIII